MVRPTLRRSLRHNRKNRGAGGADRSLRLGFERLEPRAMLTSLTITGLVDY
jgi:hypothetical protein